MKKIKTIFMILAMTLVVFACKRAAVKASDGYDISINVPSRMDIIFNADGTETVKDMCIENDSFVPIELQNINIKEFNGWKLVPAKQKILTNTKQLSLLFGGKELSAGYNEIKRQVAEGTKYNFDVTIKRGAWTQSIASEKAMELEIEYQIIEKKHTLILDGNEYTEDGKYTLKEGDSIELPYPEDTEYAFLGWMDHDGKLYEDHFIMPSSDTTLTAMFRFPTYAIFSESDGSLTFVQTFEELWGGEEYNGKEVTTAYSGFETMRYTDARKPPWYNDGTYKKVRSVVFEDYVFPQNTTYWFYGFENCMNFDVSKLNTNFVRDMSFMYYSAGKSGAGLDFVIIGMENWDTSRATTMLSMFEYSGQNAKNYRIGNIGLWDVSNVSNMQSMFKSAGMYATEFYLGNLDTWNTSSLEVMAYMFSGMGWKASYLNIGNIGTWDVSQVEMMTSVFMNMGEYSETIILGDLGSWEVGQVYDFSNMFQNMGSYVTNFHIGDLSGWDTTGCDTMNGMFDGAGRYSSTFSLGDLSKWTPTYASEMEAMFRNAGAAATWYLDLSGWVVDYICLYSQFNKGVENKVTAPNWIN